MPRLVSSEVVEPKVVTAKLVAAIALLVLCGVLISCGSSKSSITAQPPPAINGPWEFIAVSSNTSLPWTGIEVALQEGTVLVNGIPQPNGQISATGPQMAFVSLVPDAHQNINATGFGGNCQPVTPADSLGPNTVTTLAAPISFTFTENGNVFNVSATISGDGKSVLNGTYIAQSGNGCIDPGGTITGIALSKLSGTYAGKMCPLGSTSCQSPQDFTDTATATVGESPSGALTLNLVLTGTDNTGFTMTGLVTGNAFTAQGTFQGQTITYYGYYEQFYDSKLKTTLPSLYLVNATNAAQPAYVGTLEVPQT